MTSSRPCVRRMACWLCAGRRWRRGALAKQADSRACIAGEGVSPTAYAAAEKERRGRAARDQENSFVNRRQVVFKVHVNRVTSKAISKEEELWGRFMREHASTLARVVGVEVEEGRAGSGRWWCGRRAGCIVVL